MNANQKNTIDEVVDLERRISEAEFLIIYTCQSGIGKRKEENGEEIVIEDNDIANIVKAKNAYNTDKWNEDIETKFFISLRKFSQVIRPVSVESIKNNYVRSYYSVLGYVEYFLVWIVNQIRNVFSNLAGKGKSKFYETTSVKTTRAGYITREFSTITLVIIIILLFFQTKYIIGTGLYQEYQSELELCTIIGDSLKRTEYIPEKDLDSIQNIKYDSMQAAFLDHHNKKSEVGRLLKEWNRPWDKYFTSLFPEENEEPIDVISGNPANPDFIFRATKYVLSVLYAYILPILYGLLGGACLVLRILAKEIRNYTLLSDQSIRFYLRLVLGALSGLAIGWFFGVEEINNILTLKALSPLGLAFIGGYSVDLLFSLLDGLLSKFSTSNVYSEQDQVRV